jgi:hypothetical protein
LIGGVLAKKFKLPVIVSFVGLGRVFSSDSMPLKLLRQFTIAAYKYIASNKRCIFMFEHDRDRKNWLSWLDSKNNRLLLLMVQALIQNIQIFS